jgi:hypothetical protein
MCVVLALASGEFYVLVHPCNLTTAVQDNYHLVAELVGGSNALDLVISPRGQHGIALPLKLGFENYTPR